MYIHSVGSSELDRAALPGCGDRHQRRIQQACCCSQSCIQLPADRQSELNDGTTWRIWCRPYAAAVVLDDRAANREAHAHAAELGRIEGIEDTVEILPRKPSPRAHTRHKN